MYYKSAPFGVLLLVALSLVIAGFKSSGAGIRAQNRPERASGSERTQVDASGGVVRLSAPAKPASGAGFKGVGLAAFDAAASRNVQLQNGLEWSFGGKLQHGWHLYTPLIGDLIGAGVDVAASEFAMRVSLWQKENGVEATGVLDGETWSQMISTFQSRRIPGRPYLAPNQLVTIPISDCYDPTRAEELRSAERETFAAYKRMVAAAAADPSLGLQVGGDGQFTLSEKLLKVISAFRSREYQDQLRRQSPNSGRAGLAINSPHSTGRALDLYVGGEPVSTKDENRALQTQSAVYRWLVKNAARFGFRPYFYEPWHWEYVGVRTAGATPRPGDAAK
jgi:zinc D-Ala-D-Ala carboxypeptidase